jgi:hypothetical protein
MSRSGEKPSQYASDNKTKTIINKTFVYAVRNVRCNSLILE